MGIENLLQTLSAIKTKTNIKEYKSNFIIYKDKTIGIDGHCFLHKGAFVCGQLVSNNCYDKESILNMYIYLICFAVRS